MDQPRPALVPLFDVPHVLLTFVGGIIGIWFPDQVTTAAQNIANLLAAIPESLWWLFSTGYLGYTGARSFDKMKIGK